MHYERYCILKALGLYKKRPGLPLDRDHPLVLHRFLKRFDYLLSQAE